jgi:hypothetical protein
LKTVYAFITQLEAFGDEIERFARTPDQKRIAMEFQRFVFETSCWLTPRNIAAKDRELNERDGGRGR